MAGCLNGTGGMAEGVEDTRVDASADAAALVSMVLEN